MSGPISADKSPVTRDGTIPSQGRAPNASAAPPGGGHPAAADPLSDEHRAQITQAQQRLKKIRRATHVASFNAWSFAILAGFSLLFALFSVYSLIAAVVLAGLAWNEFRGRRQLKQLDRRGPATLGINQLLCCLAIALYCGLKLYDALVGPGLYAEAIEQSPELASTLEPLKELIKTATISAYVLILIVGVAAQGATAWYYFSRKRWVVGYLQQTPGWVVDLLRNQAQA